MSKKSLTKPSRVSIAADLERTEPVAPKLIRTQQDVIHQFFDQMLELIVDDFLVIESEETPEENDATELHEELSQLKHEHLNASHVRIVESARSSTKNLMTASSNKHLTAGNSKQLMSRSSKQLMSKSSKQLMSNSSKQLIANSTSSKNLKSDIFSVKSSLASSASIYNALREEYDARIIFKNGGVYEGRVRNKIMNGNGKYVWPDGTVYEGTFEDGFPNGSGIMTLPDIAYYIGRFRNGFFHGQGFLNLVATTKFYNGQWRNGKKHGQGWFLYEPNDWYDGQWSDNLRQGTGIRCFKNGTKYKGEWYRGKQQGNGIIIWPNNDVRMKWGDFSKETDHFTFKNSIGFEF